MKLSNKQSKVLFEMLATLYSEALWVTQHSESVNEFDRSWSELFGDPEWWKTQLDWLEQKAEIFEIDLLDLKRRANEKPCWVDVELDEFEQIKAGLNDIRDGRFREIQSVRDMTSKF